ncbi:Resolvase/invertase-type recombinase catalytic domain-containing protein, partial [Dysosmobacter welbionis]
THQHGKGKDPNLRRDLLCLRLEALQLHRLKIMGQHLKIHGAVIASQHTDQPPHHIGEHGRVQPCLKAGERRLIVGGAHIRQQNVQLAGEGRACVHLEALQHTDHIAAGFQLLLDGG